METRPRFKVSSEGLVGWICDPYFIRQVTYPQHQGRSTLDSYSDLFGRKVNGQLSIIVGGLESKGFIPSLKSSCFLTLENKTFKGFSTYWGMITILVSKLEPFEQIFVSPVPKRLKMKYGQKWPRNFRDESFENVDDGWWWTSCQQNMSIL